jgi:hypothetical protein
MKRLFPLKPHVRKNPVGDLHRQKQPQLNGIPGWVLLTHDENQAPKALFVDTNERVSTFSVVLDERLFSDTVFRAIKISPRIIVLCDIRWLNGTPFHERHPFEDRKTCLEALLDTFHSPLQTALITPEQAPLGTLVRGYEYYDNLPGSVGVFNPADE